MQELKYLIDKEIISREEAFITDIIYPMKNGRADIHLYDVFPGVQLMITTFESETCYQDGMEQDVISINHCFKGRFECVFDNRNCAYMGEGDIAINNVLHSPIASSFPLNYYAGSTIILYPRLCKTVPELNSFGIDTDILTRKYSLDTRCMVFRRNENVEHIYRELYRSLTQPELPYLRLKILELLYHFQARQTVLEENHEYMAKPLTEKIKHVRNHLIEDLEHSVSLKELAAEHEISLTQLKTSFKQVYGETPYVYLKRYKMHIAAKLLLETKQRVIEIAAAMGYQNPSKFTEAFFSVMGKRPLEYRKQNEEQ